MPTTHSSGYVVAPSELEQINGKCPVESEHFVSPGNALRLKWKSLRGADWQMTIRMPLRIGAELETAGDTVSMWCYSEEGLSHAAAPILRIHDADGPSTARCAALGRGRESAARRMGATRIFHCRILQACTAARPIPALIRGGLAASRFASDSMMAKTMCCTSTTFALSIPAGE